MRHRQTSAPPKAKPASGFDYDVTPAASELHNDVITEQQQPDDVTNEKRQLRLPPSAATSPQQAASPSVD